MKKSKRELISEAIMEAVKRGYLTASQQPDGQLVFTLTAEGHGYLKTLPNAPGKPRNHEKA